MQTLKLARIEVDSDYVAYNFDCDFIAQCDGTSIWSDTSGKYVHVTGINIVHNAYDDSIGTQVNVTHDCGWDIYTDKGFERAISDAVGFAVTFTEQGMQEDEFASMEA
jgi:hypothetical protein